MHAIRVYLIPAAVFQGVIFGGAYGTGREIVEFVSRHGPLGGLLALGIVLACFAVVLGLCFELARRFDVFDYRSFTRILIGRAWFLFELLFLVAVPLVLAVNVSAAATILNDRFLVPGWVGIGGMLTLVLLLGYFGREILERTMFFCMLGLLAVLAVIVLRVHGASSVPLADLLGGGATQGQWAVSGLQYALYNVAVVPALLYCARDIRSSRESATAALVAAVAGTLPAVVFHLTFMTRYPGILDEALPVYALLKELPGAGLFTAYIVILFLMMLQTVSGLLQGLIERLDNWSLEIRGSALAKPVRAGFAGGVFLLSIVLAQFGIIALIARGYGMLAWGYLLVFVIPLLTVGAYRLYSNRARS